MRLSLLSFHTLSVSKGRNRHLLAPVTAIAPQELTYELRNGAWSFAY